MSFIKNLKSFAFWRALKTDLLIVLSIILSLVVLGLNINAQFRNTERNNCIEQANDGLELVSDQIRRIQESLNKRSDTFSMMLSNRDAEKSLNVVNLLNIRQQVSDVVDSNSLVHDMALFFYQKDLVITANQIFYSIDDFLSFYSVGMDKDVFLECSDGQSFVASSYIPCSYISSRSLPRASTAFCYLIPLDTSGYSTSKGVAFLFFNRQKVIETILTNAVQERGSMQLYDRNGRILIDSSAEWESGSYYPVEISVENSYGTLRADIKISEEYFSEVLHPIYIMIVGMCLLSLLVGIIFAFGAAYHQSQPTITLMKTLMDKGILKNNGKSEYLLLSESIEKIITKNEDIKHRIAAYEESLQSNLIERLLNNNIASIEQEQELLAHFKDFPLPCMVFYGRIYVSSADSNHALSMARVISLDYLRSLLPENAILHSIDSLTLALIYPCNGQSSAVEQEVKEIIEKIEASFSVRIVFISAGKCENIQSIGTAFARAQLAFVKKSLINGEQELIANLEDESNKSDHNALNIRNLQNLSQFLLVGDAIHAKQCVRSFFSELGDNIEADARQRYYTIRVVMLLVQKEVADDGEQIDINLPNSFSSIEVDKLVKIIYDACDVICNAVMNRARRSKVDLVESLRDYLDNNYQDSELCASVIAEKFNLSEKYLFDLFKDNTGYSPISYLHHIRMKHSADLLMATNLTVQEISEKVGFSNLGTFQKAFKREYGLAPSKYRSVNK